MFDSQLIRIILAAMLAAFPAFFWGYIFLKKQPEKRTDVLRLFISGAISVAPLLLYKYLWQYFPWINAFTYTNNFSDDMLGFANMNIIPVSVLLTFMIVGVIEETAKFFAVKEIHHKRMQSVTDCIEFFIIASLGFSFTENVIYFQNIMAVRGVEQVFLPFIFRSLFSTFAHIMFSGILGYFYGLAHFAEPILKESWSQKKWTIVRTLSRIFRYKKEILFHHEMMLEGLLTAIFLHAIFDVLLEMNWTFLIVPFLAGGFLVLSYLFDNKQIDKDYQLIEN